MLGDGDSMTTRKSVTGGNATDGAAVDVDCLSNEEILLYIEGNTSEEQRHRIEHHLDGCLGCREVVHFLVCDEEASGEPSLDVTTFVPGDVVNDRYVIERFVGKGGMGEVYRCFDRLLCRPVALKTLLCSEADSRRAVRKLYTEVKNAQRVAHPHVCRIYELQQHEDIGRFFQPVPFFTMEFVEGERLGTCIHREPALPLADVKAIAEQMLEGLSAAHARGILHLDFKGDNVLLRRGPGHIDSVIMDFGLSRACDAQGSVPMSESAHFAGTLPYMSLEQLEGRNDLGPAADVYAFGVVLYEMLTRRLPFEGATLSAMLLKQLKERPDPPSRHRLGLSSAIDAFVLRCLKPDPRDRHPDAGAALAALRGIRSWEKPIYKRRRAVWFGLTTALTAGVASAGFLVAAGVASDGDATMPSPARAALEPPRESAPTAALAAQAPPEGAPLVPEPTIVAPPRDRARAPARARPPTLERRPSRPSAEAKPPSRGPTWTPSAVPKSGFWHPPQPASGTEPRSRR